MLAQKLQSNQQECPYCSAIISRTAAHQTCANCTRDMVTAYGPCWYENDWHKSLMPAHNRFYDSQGDSISLDQPTDTSTGVINGYALGSVSGDQRIGSCGACQRHQAHGCNQSATRAAWARYLKYTQNKDGRKIFTSSPVFGGTVI